MISRKLHRHIKRRFPSLGAYKDFMFFSNSKTGQKFILWNLLRNRTFIAVCGYRNYKIFFDSLTDLDIVNSFKFTIVRNPWDRAVSAYFYTLKAGRILVPLDTDFKDFIKIHLYPNKLSPTEVDRHFHFQYPNAYFRKTRFVDFVGRFENLEKDWKFIASVINCSAKLPHDNSTNHKHYTEYYDQESKEMVAEICKKDIDLFGYSYE